MADRRSKHKLIYISSSEEEETEDDISFDDDEDESEDENHDDEDSDGDEILSDRVLRFLKDGKNLDSLRLEDCKAYLRENGLRIAGTKSVCIQRVEEHWRLKDGNGEARYPRSSFVVNCTGDVCRGDIVLFTQKVYAKFDKVTRHGGLIGRRTIAGRVINESYGANKQQHTFTVSLHLFVIPFAISFFWSIMLPMLVIIFCQVEVLWSKGIRKLTPLFPLLVKGRNLYKLRTFRQFWNDEGERLQVLAEKHKRGAAARGLRALKTRKSNFSANGGTKRGGARNQRQDHLARQTLNRNKQESGRRGIL